MKKMINVKINGKPENYSRERKGRFGFYNTKSKQMGEFKTQVFNSISKEEREFMKNLMNNNIEYYVEINAKFFMPTPKGDSKKVKKLKEDQKILPNKIPDVDNLIKFDLDALHDVFYTDDKIVTGISAKKYYSENPRTELEIIIFDMEE